MQRHIGHGMRQLQRVSGREDANCSMQLDSRRRVQNMQLPLGANALCIVQRQCRRGVQAVLVSHHAVYEKRMQSHRQRSMFSMHTVPIRLLPICAMQQRREYRVSALLRVCTRPIRASELHCWCGCRVPDMQLLPSRPVHLQCLLDVWRHQLRPVWILPCGVLHKRPVQRYGPGPVCRLLLVPGWKLSDSGQ